MFSIMETKYFSKTENNFFKKVKENKKKNTFLSGEINNFDSPKVNKNNNYSCENLNKISKSKNAEKIKRLKKLFEKGGKFIYENMQSPQRSNNLQGSFNKKFKESEYFKKNDRRIFNENNNNENNMNSDLLRLELMNLNCYTQKDIKSIKGKERFSSLNYNNDKKKILLKIEE